MASASLAIPAMPVSISPPPTISPAAFLSTAASPIFSTNSIRKRSAFPPSAAIFASASTIASPAAISIFRCRGAACCAPSWQDSYFLETFLTSPEPILFCWSGGKDSAMALHALLQQKDFRVVALLTTVTETRVPGFVLANPGSTEDRVAMHGVRRELLQRQAASIGIPLHEVFIPPQCVNSVYEARMEEALRLFYNQGIRKVAFGDIFLEDLRVYREKNLARIGMTALFPIWKRDTRELIRFFHSQPSPPTPPATNPRVPPPASPGPELEDSFSGNFPPNAVPSAKTGEFPPLFF